MKVSTRQYVAPCELFQAGEEAAGLVLHNLDGSGFVNVKRSSCKFFNRFLKYQEKYLGVSHTDNLTPFSSSAVLVTALRYSSGLPWKSGFTTRNKKKNYNKTVNLFICVFYKKYFFFNT